MQVHPEDVYRAELRESEPAVCVRLPRHLRGLRGGPGAEHRARGARRLRLAQAEQFPSARAGALPHGLHARERARVRHLPAREGAQEAELVAHRARVPHAQEPLLQRARLGAHSAFRAAHAALQRAAVRAQCATARVQRRALR